MVFNKLDVEKRAFEELRKRFIETDMLREEIIKNSRDILKRSKQAIFALHREDFTKAENLIKQAEAIKKNIEKIAQDNPNLLLGAFDEALEEYAEAKMFHSALKGKNIPKLSELAISQEAYIGGICDFTGELVRLSAKKAIDNDLESVENLKESVEGILESLLEFDFRNNGLRRKYDSVKYNLQRIENILYEMKILKRV